MKAGTLEIEVLALYGKLEKQLQEVASKVEKSAAKAGDDFKKTLDKKMEEAGKSGGERLQKFLVKAFAADALTRAVEQGLKGAVEGKGWQDSLLQAIESLPIIGSVSKIFGSLLDLATGASAKMREAQEAQKKAEEERKRINEETARRVAAQQNIDNMGLDIQEMAKQKELDSIRAAGDKKAAIAKQVELDIFKLQRKLQDDLSKSKYKEERDAFEKKAKAEEGLIRHRGKLELEAVEKEEREKADAAAADEREKAKLKREERLKELEDQAQTIEERRKGVMSDTGSMQTAHGTFTFAAYPESEKKAMDAAMLSELRGIREEQKRLRSEGGFS